MNISKLFSNVNRFSSQTDVHKINPHTIKQNVIHKYQTQISDESVPSILPLLKIEKKEKKTLINTWQS